MANPIRAANGLVKFTFTKSYMAYNKGQTAGFTEIEARRLESQGYGQIHYPVTVDQRAKADAAAPQRKAPERVQIPTAWKGMHHLAKWNIAHELEPDLPRNAKAAEVNEIIEAEVKRRGAVSRDTNLKGIASTGDLTNPAAPAQTS